MHSQVDTHVAFGGLLVLLFLAAVAITMIVLLARKRWGRVVLASVLLVGLAVGLLHSLRVSTLHRVREKQAQAQAELEEARAQALREQDLTMHGTTQTAVTLGWDADLERKFEPDIYGTKELAVAGIGRQLVEEAFLNAARGDRDADEPLLESPGHVPADERVPLTVYADDRALFEAMRPVVRSDPRLSEIRRRPAHEMGSTVGQDFGQMAIRFHDAETVGTADGEVKELTGFVLYDSREVERTVRFVDRPWLEKLYASGGRFSVTWNTNPHEIITASSGLAVDPTTTRAEAIEQAQRMVHDLVYDQIRDARAFGNWGTVTLPRSLTDFIERTITEPDQWKRSSEAQPAGPLLKDTFTQRFDRDYGAVYRTAVHVEVPQPLLETFVQMALQHEKNQRNTWFVKGVSLAAMFLLIVLAYAFLNAATKGYFRAWLIGGSLAVIVAGMCVVLFVA